MQLDGHEFNLKINFEFLIAKYLYSQLSEWRNLIIIVECLKAALLQKNSTAKINEWSTSMYLKYLNKSTCMQLKYLN